jgi:limonene-1,2-epoxide hydrolase
MSEHHEKIVLSLIDRLNARDDQAVLESFAPNGSYRVNAWHEPLVGTDAIAADFERQHTLWSDLRIAVINIASTSRVVFTERIDTVHMMDRDVAIHMAGVFEFDGNDKIVSWRDYFDMKEVESQLGG